MATLESLSSQTAPVQTVEAEQPSGDWWENNYALKERITTPLLEGYKFSSFGRDVDVLNFSNDALSGKEQQEIAETLAAIASFTGGKVFDRILGIAFAPEDIFGNTKDGVFNARPNVGGQINRMNPVVFMNMDSIQRPLDASFDKFIAQRIPGRKVTQLQYTLAHEIGHAFDLLYLSEIDKHGIDKDSGNSNWMGFGDMTKSFTAFEHPDPTVHLFEKSPSSRSRAGAVEEFAEVFALATLGADASQFPRKYQRLLETVQLANGESMVGPHKFEITKFRTLIRP